jgi:hypothetical protein
MQSKHWRAIAGIGLAAGLAAAGTVAAGTARADDLFGDKGTSVYGPRHGTGTHFYGAQPNSGSDAWNQPRRPRLENRWRRAPGMNPWNQPRQPDLYPWGKPKY